MPTNEVSSTVVAPVAARRSRRAALLAAAAVFAAPVAVGGVALAQGRAMTLLYGGKPASARLRVIGGETYVPVRDVAKALGMEVVKRDAATLELTRAGGANQLEGTRGKVGDVLFNGHWRFQVNKIRVVRKYDRINEYYGETEIAPNEGEVLLVAECTARNGRKETTALRVIQDKTAVAAQDDTTAPMVGCDMKTDGARTYSPGVLPGAAFKVVLCFSVPRDFQPKDLVVTLQANLEEETEGTLRFAVSPSDISGAGAE